MRVLLVCVLSALARSAQSAAPALSVDQIETRLDALRKRVDEMSPEERTRFNALEERLEAMKRSAEMEREAKTPEEEHDQKEYDHEKEEVKHAAVAGSSLEATRTDDELDNGVLWARLEAIKKKIHGSDSLSKDPEVQAALKRVTAKFESAGLDKPAINPATNPAAVKPAPAKPAESKAGALERGSLDATLSSATSHLASLQNDHGDDGELMGLIAKARGHIAKLGGAGATDAKADDVTNVIAKAQATLERLEGDAGAKDKTDLADAHALLDKIQHAPHNRKGPQDAKRALEREPTPSAAKPAAEDLSAFAPAVREAFQQAREHVRMFENLVDNADSLDAERTESVLEEHLPKVQATVMTLKKERGLIASSPELQGLIKRTRVAVAAIEKQLKDADGKQATKADRAAPAKPKAEFERGEAADEASAEDQHEEAMGEARALERELRKGDGAELARLLPRVQKLRARVLKNPSLRGDDEMSALLRSATQHLERVLERADVAESASQKRRTRAPARKRSKGRVLSSD